MLLNAIARRRRLLEPFITLTLVALVASVVCRSAFPVGDPAVFEYIGRSLDDGAHLYTDLWDNKLPSIYLVNALWWRLFGSNYELHLIAESLVNAGTIVLFAAILRAFGVERWRPAVLAFGVLFLFIGGPFNQTEHYAVPLMLAAILFALHHRTIFAGTALVLASTFWIPAIAIGIVPLLYRARPRERWTLIASSFVATLLCGVAIVASYGIATTSELIHSWLSYEAAHFEPSSTQEPHHYLIPFFSPRYYIQSGLGILFGLIAASWTRSTGPARHFALCWASSGIVVVFALGKPSIHYFLAVYAPLVMLLATTQPLTVDAFRRHWYFSGIAVLSAIVMVFSAVRDARTPFFGTPSAIQYTGDVVREAFGPSAVGMLPWEIYLAADARPPGRFFLARGNVHYARVRDRWVHRPVVFVDAVDLRYNGLAPPADLQVQCTNRRMSPYIVRTVRDIPGLRCVRP